MYSSYWKISSTSPFIPHLILLGAKICKTNSLSAKSPFINIKAYFLLYCSAFSLTCLSLYSFNLTSQESLKLSMPTILESHISNNLIAVFAPMNPTTPVIRFFYTKKAPSPMPFHSFHIPHPCVLMFSASLHPSYTYIGFKCKNLNRCLPLLFSWSFAGDFSK